MSRATSEVPTWLDCGLASPSWRASPSAASSCRPAARAQPAHSRLVSYAPYFETWTTDSLTTISQQSGVKHFTLAFLETTSKTSCTLAWDGDVAQPVSG